MSGVGTETTKHKLQLFIQRHSQVATVFSKGFYNNIQCKCGTYFMLLEVELSEGLAVKTVFLSAHLKRVRLGYYRSVLVILGRLVKTSRVPSPHTPPSGKRSSE